MNHRLFLDALGGVVEARLSFDRYLLDVGLDWNQYGKVYVRTKGGQADHLRARLMLEATFKAMKYLQHGADSTLRDAMDLWIELGGAVALDQPESRSFTMDGDIHSESTEPGIDG